MNVLALQLKRIGDLVLTAPALRAMKLGGAHVTLVVTDGTAALLPALVGCSVDEALVYRMRGGGNLALWRRLLRGGFDVCVDFTGRDRSALMALLSRAPKRVVTRPALRKGGWRRLVYNTLVDSSVSSRHTVDLYLDHLAAVPMANTQAREHCDGASLQLPPVNMARAGELLAVAQIGEGEPFVVLHPGSARSEKYWVPDRWAQVIRFLRSERRLRCVLTGGIGDSYEQEHLARIRAALAADAGSYVDFAGRLDLLTLTAVLARAALVISVDSGPMHLAAAFDRPQIALFGPTNPFHWRPRHHHAAVLQSGHGDAPVRDFDARGAGGPMDAISTEAVIDAIKSVSLKESQK